MGSQAQLRALFVINSLAGGGAERVFTTLVRELNGRADSFAITVALLDEEAEEAYSLPEGIPVQRLDTGGGMFRSVTQLRRLVGQLRPDVTVSFLSRANVAAVVAMRRTGGPTVISERVNTTAHLKSGRFAFLSRLLIRGTYPTASRIVAVSEGVARTLESDFSVEPERICVIYNPVDIDRIRKLAAWEPEIEVSSEDFVTMGRLVANKNTAMAIRALAASGSAGKLIVLGEGPLRDELVALAVSLGIADRVRLAGFVANPYAVLARAGCYLLTSNAEGFPNAMLEAMACGLPVIATDCPSGPAEILQVGLENTDKDGGAVFGSGGALVAMDDDRAMAHCMDRLSQPERRKACVDEGLDRVDAFSVSRAVAAFRETILAAATGNGVLPG